MKNVSRFVLRKREIFFFLFPDFLKNNILVEYDKKEH